MIIVAASSSSKTEWALIQAGQIVDYCVTDSVNPYYQKRKEISRLVRLQLPERFFQARIDCIYYYGVGCSTQEKKDQVKASLVTQFRTQVVVESIIVASAISLYGGETGVACILGYTSSSCLYDGKEITEMISPIGFILGDDGSSVSLGRMFLRDYLKNQLPERISLSFYEQYGVKAKEIFDAVYYQPHSYMFLSSVADFLVKNQDDDYIYNLVYENFKSFFVRNLSQYDCEAYSVGFVGKMASDFEQILRTVAKDMGVEVAKILESPLGGLVKYHTSSIIQLNTLLK